MKHFLDLLNANGFLPADQMKHFGSVLPGVYYAYKVRGGIYEYVSLVSYEGRFCEAVYELYMAEKNTFRAKGTPKPSELAKRGFLQLVAALPRTMADLTKYVTKTDAQVKEEAMKMFNLLLEGEKRKV